MVDIEKIKTEIIESLKPLDPEKVILFGSYAYGNPTEDSDIDLLLIKDIEKNNLTKYELNARKRIRDLIFKYNVGFDILATSQELLDSRDDHFYKVDLLSNGKVLYAK